MIKPKRSDEDKRPYILELRAGIRDHRAAIGVSHQNHWAIDLTHYARGVFAVDSQAAQRVGDGACRDPSRAKLSQDRRPTRRIDEGAVHEDYAGVGMSCHHHQFLSVC
jgi:hypothetical protein